MREIVSISSGQCGNQLGYKFWERIISEHGIDYTGQYIGSNEDQLKRIDVFFDEINTSQQARRFVPRTVLVDLEPGVLDSIKGHSQMGQLFHPDRFIHEQSGAGSNWARGHYSEGAELLPFALEQIRLITERCDSLQGFQMTHSLGGGTGSGLGTLIISKLKEEYPDRLIQSFAVVPSPKVSDVVVEPYNATLSLHQLVEHTDSCVMLDNEALYSICGKNLKIDHPTYGDLNHLVALAMSGSTCSMRFPGSLNADLRKLLTNLCPFPRLHFFSVALAPLYARSQKQYASKNDVSELIQNVFDSRNSLCAADTSRGKHLSAALTFRGKASASEIETQTLKALQSKNNHFTEWIPNGIKLSMCDVSTDSAERSAILLANNTSIQEVFRRVDGQFSSLFRRKAFLHWYCDEGMDEMEFQEAKANLSDIVSEYQQYEEAQIEGDYENKDIEADLGSTQATFGGFHSVQEKQTSKNISRKSSQDEII